MDVGSAIAPKILIFSSFQNSILPDGTASDYFKDLEEIINLIGFLQTADLEILIDTCYDGSRVNDPSPEDYREEYMCPKEGLREIAQKVGAVCK